MNRAIRACTLLLFLSAVVTSACRKRSTASAPAEVPVTSNPSPNPPEAASIATPGTQGIPANADAQNPAQIKAAFERYFAMTGHSPSSWQDMIQAKCLPAVPLAKSGQPLDMQAFFTHHR